MPEDIGYARSKLLSLFVFFGLTKEDAALFVETLEVVDTSYSQTVNISDFGDKYCSDLRYIFEFMWNAYCCHWEHFGEYGSKELPENGNNNNNNTNDPASYSKESAHYMEFIVFLIFSLGIPEEDNAVLLFWLWFYVSKKNPSMDSLCDLVDWMWKGTKRRLKWAQHYKQTIRKNLRYVDFGTFNAQKLRIYDIQTGSPWTYLILRMKNRLRRKFIGTSFWSRMNQCYRNTINDFRSAMNRVTDLKIEGVEETITDHGDRKVVRKFLRKFMRFHRAYSMMPVGDAGLQIEFEGGSFISFVSKPLKLATDHLSKYIKFPGLSANNLEESDEATAVEGSSGKLAALSSNNGRRLSPGILPSLKTMSRKGSQRDGDMAGDQPKALVPLEYRYRATLTEPIDSLLSRAADAKTNAHRVLEEAKDFDDSAKFASNKTEEPQSSPAAVSKRRTSGKNSPVSEQAARSNRRDNRNRLRSMSSESFLSGSGSGDGSHDEENASEGDGESWSGSSDDENRDGEESSQDQDEGSVGENSLDSGSHSPDDNHASGKEQKKLSNKSSRRRKKKLGVVLEDDKEEEEI